MEISHDQLVQMFQHYLEQMDPKQLESQFKYFMKEVEPS